MIQGQVIDDEPVIRLTVLGPTGARAKVVAVIDTGYTQALTLNSRIIEKLELKWEIECDVILADGSMIHTNRFAAEIIWDGKNIIPISIDESVGDCLVGVALLQGHEVNMQFRNRGKVVIVKLK